MWPYITVVVEGPSDLVVLSKVLGSQGAFVSAAHGMRGKGWIDTHIKRYNAAAHYGLWLVLRDLNSDASCAPTLCASLLPNPAPLMSLRIAVRELEAWILADTVGLGKYLGIPRNTIPGPPDDLQDPKTTLVSLARTSRHRRIRVDMVPASG